MIKTVTVLQCFVYLALSGFMYSIFDVGQYYLNFADSGEWEETEKTVAGLSLFSEFMAHERSLELLK